MAGENQNNSRVLLIFRYHPRFDRIRKIIKDLQAIQMQGGHLSLLFSNQPLLFFRELDSLKQFFNHSFHTLYLRFVLPLCSFSYTLFLLFL